MKFTVNSEIKGLPKTEYFNKNCTSNWRKVHDVFSSNDHIYSLLKFIFFPHNFSL